MAATCRPPSPTCTTGKNKNQPLFSQLLDRSRKEAVILRRVVGSKVRYANMFPWCAPAVT